MYVQKGLLVCQEIRDQSSWNKNGTIIITDLIIGISKTKSNHLIIHLIILYARIFNNTGFRPTGFMTAARLMLYSSYWNNAKKCVKSWEPPESDSFVMNAHATCKSLPTPARSRPQMPARKSPPAKVPLQKPTFKSPPA